MSSNIIEPNQENSVRSRILEELKDVRGLPTLPTVFLNVMTMMRNPATPMKDIARTIEADPAITMKILRLINSSFYGLAKTVDSVHQAIVLLGANTIKNVVISVSIFRAVGQDQVDSGFDRTAFWQHSIGVGLIARFLEKRLGIGRSEEGFIAGVIHDIGKIVIDKYLSEELVEIMKLVREQNIEMYDAEQIILEISHCEIGAFLASKWKLPDNLVDAILNHHQIDPESEHAAYASLIQISNAIARKYKVGSGGDDIVPEIEPAVWDILELSPEMLEEWDEEIQGEIEKSREMLDALIS